MKVVYEAEDILKYVDLKDLYQFLSVGDPERLPEKIKYDIERESSSIVKYINPLVFYNEYKNLRSENHSIVIGGVSIDSRVLSNIARESLSVYVFILSIGDKIESYVSELYESTQLVRSQIVDAFGSLYVEAVADYFMRDIEKNLPENLILSARYSPGYCDISLIEQSKIFDLIGDENQLIKLNNSYQMIPQKSISGLFFKIDSMSGKRYRDYYIFCHDCENRLCRYYRK